MGGRKQGPGSLSLNEQSERSPPLFNRTHDARKGERVMAHQEHVSPQARAAATIGTAEVGDPPGPYRCPESPINATKSHVQDARGDP
jgi:hypothetical protein